MNPSDTRTLKLPNLLIIGAQKCGTTWLHQALNKSEHFWGSSPKELNYFNRVRFDLQAYAKHFEEAPASAEYWYESTPHYFRMPKNKLEISARIRDTLGDIPLILLLRNPVDRYLSAYTHHMMKSRVPVVKEITEISEDFNLVDFGDYYSILKHYKEHFSTINIFLHDEIVANPHDVVKRICADLNVECDLTPEDLDFRTNDKVKKQKRLEKTGQRIDVLPELSPAVRLELKERFRDGISKLESEYGLDVGRWLT